MGGSESWGHRLRKEATGKDRERVEQRGKVEGHLEARFQPCLKASSFIHSLWILQFREVLQRKQEEDHYISLSFLRRSIWRSEKESELADSHSKFTAEMRLDPRDLRVGRPFTPHTTSPIFTFYEKDCSPGTACLPIFICEPILHDMTVHPFTPTDSTIKSFSTSSLQTLLR